MVILGIDPGIATVGFGIIAADTVQLNTVRSLPSRISFWKRGFARSTMP